MKKIIVSLSVLLMGFTATYAQCGKAVTMAASKTEYYDGNMVLQRTVEEKSTIEINKAEIIIVPGDSPKQTGTILSDSCNWTVPFNEGKSILKISFTGEQGNTRKATVTIEGKGGVVSLLFEMEDANARKIRVVLDQFQEKK